MPNWLIPVIVSVVGSGGLASFIIPFVNHKLQQRREREREGHEARAAWVARKRHVCLDLLDVVIRYKSLLRTVRSLHDDRVPRPVARKQFKLMLQQLQPLDETVRRFRRELDLEPNAQLQGVIERWGDAGIAYLQALIHPMSSWWNPVRFFLGKTSPGEVNRLADALEARTQELQTAVREYVASLELPVKAAPARRSLRLHGRRRA